MNKKSEEAEDYAALIGIDWADERHEIWLFNVAEGSSNHRTVEQSPEALAAWLGELQGQFQGKKIAICLEQTRGALIYSLMGHGFLTLYPINPIALARYREAFFPSRAKDDPTDARLLMEILRLHRDKLRAWQPDDVQTRTLALLNEERRKTVDLRTKLIQRLIAALKNYYPQALNWAGHLERQMAHEFLLKWPTLDAIQKARPNTVRAFFFAHKARNVDLIALKLKEIQEAKPLTTDQAVVTASVLTVQMLAAQLRALNASIKKYDHEIAALFQSHPDRDIFNSFPGAGPAMAPRLLVAFGSDRTRYNDAQNIQTYCGIAPVIERSGKQMWTHWRWHCPKFLRQTFHEFAGLSIQQSKWARTYYDLQIERGKHHHAALRALAFKWIRIIYRCWKERTCYDESRYLQSLEKSGSDLWRRMQMQPQES